MSFLRIAASAAVFTLVSTAGATAKPVTTTADTNLRKSPGTSSEVLTLIPKGTTVEVGQCTNGWCQVSLNGQDGYAVSFNLGIAPRGPVVAEEEVEEDGPVYGPGPGYVVGPPGYYGYGPYYYGYGPYYGGFYGGWGYGRGWGRRW